MRVTTEGENLEKASSLEKRGVNGLASVLSRWRKAQLLLAVLLILGIVFSVCFSDELLLVETPASKADAIVLLGGDPGDRVWRAVEIFNRLRTNESREAQRGTAGGERTRPFVIVSGSGQCHLMRDRLMLAGVPQTRILRECESRSTKENAAFSVKILRRLEVTSAVIVTTWWHSRRALACFQHFAPEIEFYSRPAYGVSMEGKPDMADWVLVIQEYVKTAYYGARWGIY